MHTGAQEMEFTFRLFSTLSTKERNRQTETEKLTRQILFLIPIADGISTKVDCHIIISDVTTDDTKINIQDVYNKI